MSYGILVDELQARIDARQFAELKAYYYLEPWGDRREDLRHAQTMASMAAAAGVKDVNVSDYLLEMPSEPEPPERIAERQVQALDAFLGAP